MQNWQRRDAEMKKMLSFIAMTSKLEALKRDLITTKRTVAKLLERKNGLRNLLRVNSSDPESNNNSRLDNVAGRHVQPIPRVVPKLANRPRSTQPPRSNVYSNRKQLIKYWSKPSQNLEVAQLIEIRRQRAQMLEEKIATEYLSIHRRWEEVDRAIQQNLNKG